MKATAAAPALEGPSDGGYDAVDVSHEVAKIRAALAGEPESMRRVYEREAPPLLRRLRHLCGDRALAQDLLQECFLRAFAGEVTFGGASRAGPWLHGIAVNLWRNHMRKQGRRRKLLGRGGAAAEPAALPTPDEGPERVEAEARLHEALEVLSPPLREAFVLRTLEQLPLVEAAELAGVSMATLSRRATRAEERARAHFARAGEKPS